jgi:hypothetical protein
VEARIPCPPVQGAIAGGRAAPEEVGA